MILVAAGDLVAVVPLGGGASGGGPYQEVFKNKCRDILGKFGDCPGGFGDVP